MFCWRNVTSRKGVALVLSLVFLVVFSSLGVAMLRMTSTQVQAASNMHVANLARSSAESGLEYLRYWVSQVTIPGSVAPSQRFSYMASAVRSDLLASGIEDVTLGADALSIGTANNGIALTQQADRKFSGVIRSLDADTIQLEATGEAGGLSRKVALNYTFGVRNRSVFDFGVASRGPVQLSGNVQLTGYNVSVEADVYIESPNNNLALSIIGNSQIAGNVNIVNPNGTVVLQGGQAGIGGETGQAAITNHVRTGVPPTDFPVPNPGHFEQYVDSVVQTGADLDNEIFENVRIAAGVNPKFTGSTILRGIVYIESPNVVTFGGNVEITGIIAGDGSWTDNSGTNKVVFLGTVDSRPVSELSGDSKFDGLRDETGTFLMAPGFAAMFGGGFETLNGAIAANGITFFGNAGGTVGGSVINYSDRPMTVSGNSDLCFNRSGITEVPAGFEPEVILQCNPASYCEPI